MADKWSKEEIEILKENFSSAKWEDILSMIPDKIDYLIVAKAYKLGLKRKEDKIEEYYDEEKEMWIEITRYYQSIMGTVSSCIPSKKGTTLKQAKDNLGEKIAKTFIDCFQTRYDKFIDSIGYRFHSHQVQILFYKMEMEILCNVDKKERDKVFDKYKDRLEQIILGVLKEEKKN